MHNNRQSRMSSPARCSHRIQATTQKPGHDLHLPHQQALHSENRHRFKNSEPGLDLLRLSCISPAPPKYVGSRFENEIVEVFYRRAEFCMMQLHDWNPNDNRLSDVLISIVVNNQIKSNPLFTRLPKTVGVKPIQVTARLEQVINQVKLRALSPT
ncbi:hypothetical protein BU25DRAFT_413945 [Macroventuria anomochaeta]|uniref:Uncharacterized protein n=1 Tax=Macroventuria anomochaeta TaxID=301207 RepID=A0ACB6RS24_9PLEO|nr:uncharacterized protein BU25DRAFT_413945 [Macroventuria anomochaeta]KAF2624072.1 hypothetical protein BU25DRAFT_413945 [Macroventuria anomochaeta]